MHRAGVSYADMSSTVFERKSTMVRFDRDRGMTAGTEGNVLSFPRLPELMTVT